MFYLLVFAVNKQPRESRESPSQATSFLMRNNMFGLNSLLKCAIYKLEHV